MLEINNSGNKNQFNIAFGDFNVQKNQMPFSKGDFNALSNYLRKNGIYEPDILELDIILKADNPDLEKRQFGKGLQTWIKNMMSKALNSTWGVGIEAAGNILAQAFNSYYGWFWIKNFQNLPNKKTGPYIHMAIKNVVLHLRYI